MTRWTITIRGARRQSICLVAILFPLLAVATSEPVVKVAPMDDVGPRPLEQHTRSSIIRDYLDSWHDLNSALGQNSPELLDGSFVGLARQKLAETIKQQEHIHITTSYKVKSHDIKVVFYSPEGLSIQLTDDADYELSARSQNATIGGQEVRARYVVVLTPTESKWKVRVFQGGATT